MLRSFSFTSMSMLSILVLASAIFNMFSIANWISMD